MEERILDEEDLISVAELFQEELDVLIEQHGILTEKNTTESVLAAESLLHVINYFRVRLGIETGTELEDLYGAGPDETLH
jgi:hypothetical protein